MKDCYYLYGSDLKELKDMKYIDALERKIELAEELIKNLLEVDYMNRDMQRVNDALKAIDFNKNLIKEATEGLDGVRVTNV
jgi:hypothetical protein